MSLWVSRKQSIRETSQTDLTFSNLSSGGFVNFTFISRIMKAKQHLVALLSSNLAG
jgi:hypothetical protein